MQAIFACNGKINANVDQIARPEWHFSNLRAKINTGRELRLNFLVYIR